MNNPTTLVERPIALQIVGTLKVSQFCPFSKLVLDENEISVPVDMAYESIEDLLSDLVSEFIGLASAFRAMLDEDNEANGDGDAQ